MLVPFRVFDMEVEKSTKINAILDRFKDDIKKSGDLYTSINDKLTYFHRVLENKLQIIFVQDPNSNISSAHMQVAVGSVSNPKNIDGLAHFLEHMLFMGSDMYPGGTFFQNQVAANGGATNAYTDTDHTQYFFNTAGNFLEMLKIFSRFFINPSFDKTYVEKEVNAVDSEHNKNIGSDQWRVANIATNFYIDDIHNRFTTGTKETLLGAMNNDVEALRNELIKFYNTHYSSDKMILAISHNSIDDEFIRQVEEIFRPVKLVNTVQTDVSASVKELKNEYEQININTTGEDEYLIVRVLLEGSGRYINNLNEDSFGIILYILNSNSRGSLNKILTDMNFIISGGANVESRFSDKCMFEFQYKLTRDGMNHIDDIIYLIDAYIKHLIRVDDSSNKMFSDMMSEVQDLDILYFKTSEQISGFSSCENLLNSYTNFNIDFKYAQIISLLEGDIDAWRVHFKNTLNQIRIERFKVIRTSSSLNQDDLPMVDRMYGARYNHFVVHIDSSNVHSAEQMIEDTLRIHGCSYPERNVYIKDPYLMRVIDTIAENDPTYCTVYSENRNIYYLKKGNTYKTYSIYATFYVDLDALQKKDALAAMLCYIYLMYITELKKEEFSNMFNAKQYVYINMELGLKITAKGYNGIENIFVEVMNWVFNPSPSVDRKLYSNIHHNLMMGLQNYKYADPYALISPEFRNMVNPEDDISIEESIQTLESISPESLENGIAPNGLNFHNFQTEVLKIMSKGKVVGVMGGSATINQFNRLIRTVDGHIKPTDIPTDKRKHIELNVKDLVKKKTKIHENPENGEGAIGYGLYIGNIKETKSGDWAIKLPYVHIFNTYISDKFSSVVRTEQQVGYIATTSVSNVGWKDNAYTYILFITQSTKTDLENIVQNYIDNNMMEDIRTINDETFESLKKSTIIKLEEKPVTLASECAMMITDLLKTSDPEEYPDLSVRFTRNQMMIDALKNKASRDDFMRFVQDIYNNRIRAVMCIEPYNRSTDKVNVDSDVMSDLSEEITVN